MAKEKVFVFIGEGAGIPGLPHEVTRKEAEIRKAEDILDAALKRGVYVEKKSVKKQEMKETEEEPEKEPVPEPEKE